MAGNGRKPAREVGAVEKPAPEATGLTELREDFEELEEKVEKLVSDFEVTRGVVHANAANITADRRRAARKVKVNGKRLFHWLDGLDGKYGNFKQQFFWPALIIGIGFTYLLLMHVI